MSSRIFISFILLPAIVLGVPPRQPACADEPAPTFRENATDPFTMPTSVDPPPFDPVRASSFIGENNNGVLQQARYTTARPATATRQVSAFPAVPSLSIQAPIDYPTTAETFMSDTQSVYPLQPESQVFDTNEYGWAWQVLPDGLMYKSYMAGTRESRISGEMLYDTKDGWLLDATLGGRRGILRYGSAGANGAEGWQLDIEGAAFVRLNAEDFWDVDSVDFRFGVPLTYRRGPWQWKTGYYHLSAHVGDEFLVRNPGFTRSNYVRDSLFFGLGYYVVEDIRLYGEVGWAFRTDGGAKPFEFQIGADYSPSIENGWHGAPYAAVNLHAREDVDYGGGVNVMVGWRWKGPISGSTFRAGLRYYNGKKTQYAFFNQSEELVGFGLWYDY